MTIKVISASFVGISSYKVDVEVELMNGLPNFSIVGLGDTTISESRERVRSAIKNTGIEFPLGKIVVNLSPADIKKEGSLFDLPIAIGILAKCDVVNRKKLDDYIILGELSLNGEVKSCKGVINAAELVQKSDLKGIIIPFDNIEEASLIDNIEIIPVKTLKDVILFLNENKVRKHRIENINLDKEYNVDFSDVKGQIVAKRVFEISAAGGHNIFMIGDPGSGKSMLAKRLPTILPNMTKEEIVEVTKIYSVVGLLNKNNNIISKRPFRSPHHTASPSSLTGGGHNARPGEISISLKGVLFLDELAEFPTKVLEVLRQPLEDGQITITRVNQTVIYPVDMILVTSSNPTAFVT